MAMLMRILKDLTFRPKSGVMSRKQLGLSDSQKNVLHVGCGTYHPKKLPRTEFPESDWKEIRLDIDPDVQPNVVASITNMSMIPEDSCDAVYSSHNLEHLFAYEVPQALGEFWRVLQPGGFVLIFVPDIQTVAEWVAADRIDETAYVSPVGPITPLDMMYGLNGALASGNHFMAHRSAFTASLLRRRLLDVGFVSVDVERDIKGFGLRAMARKR